MLCGKDPAVFHQAPVTRAESDAYALSKNAADSDALGITVEAGEDGAIVQVLRQRDANSDPFETSWNLLNASLASKTPYHRDYTISSLRVHLQPHPGTLLKTTALSLYPFYRIAATKIHQLVYADRMSPSTRNSLLRAAFDFFVLEWFSDPRKRPESTPFVDSYADIAFARLESIRDVAVAEDGVNGTMFTKQISWIGAGRRHEKRVREGMSRVESKRLMEEENWEMEERAREGLRDAWAGTWDYGDDR